MGLLGPLTAQALGRSPYDDVVEAESEDEEEGDEGSEPQQQYDHRGRPVNPESKRINRDIIRAHNEVMLVVGVAEPENPQPTPSEQASKRQHFTYEEAFGTRLVWATKRCVEAVGVFGLTGTRQRILIYKHYATTPLWDTYRTTWADFDPLKDMFAGAPTALLSQYIGRRWFPPWAFFGERSFHRRCALQAWSYTRAHLELFAAFQRLGLIPAGRLLPSWRFFIPFSQDSPIPAPAPIQDFSPDSIARWLGGAFVSAMPFLLWLITQQLVDDWRPRIWQQVLTKLPSPIFGGKPICTFDTPLSLPSDADDMPVPPQEPLNSDQQDGDGIGEDERGVEGEGDGEEALVVTSPEAGTPPAEEARAEPERQPTRRRSIQSGAGAEDFEESDDDVHEGVSATLISFDVEATEATTDVPHGLWSAELRPSLSAEQRPLGSANVYLSTMLTRLPSLMAAKILNDQILRLVITPFEAIALRFVVRAWQVHHGGMWGDILSCSPPFGLTLTWIVNMLKAEFVHLSICGEVFALSSSLASYCHMSEEEWKETGGNDWGTWIGISASAEPLF